METVEQSHATQCVAHTIRSTATPFADEKIYDEREHVSELFSITTVEGRTFWVKLKTVFNLCVKNKSGENMFSPVAVYCAISEAIALEIHCNDGFGC